jgi:hypothetical protein
MARFELEPLARSSTDDFERGLLLSAKTDAARRDVRARVLDELPPVAVPPPGAVRWFGRAFASASGTRLHGVVLAVLVAAAGGAALTSFASPDAPPEEEAAIGVSLPAPPPAIEPSPLPGTSTSIPAVSPESLPNAPTAHRSRSAERAEADPLPPQIARVDAARAALARGDTQQTLALLHAYDREFPDGAFTIDVAVLRIEALTRAGKTEQARALGEEFLGRHPQGPFARRVRRTLGVLDSAPSASPP